MLSFKEYINKGREVLQPQTQSAQLRPTASKPKQNILQQGLGIFGNFIKNDFNRSPLGKTVSGLTQLPKIATKLNPTFKGVGKTVSKIAKPALDFQKGFKESQNTANNFSQNLVMKGAEIFSQNPNVKDTTVGKLIQGKPIEAIQALPETFKMANDAAKVRNENLMSSDPELRKAAIKETTNAVIGTLGPTGVIRTKVNKVLEPSVKKLVGRLTKQDILQLDEFTTAVNKAGSQGNRINLRPEVGPEVNAFLKEAYGPEAANWTNKQAKDAIEYTLKRLTELDVRPGIGLSTSNVGQNFAQEGADNVITPVKKVINALSEAKPLQKQQAAAYTAERARRIAMAQEAVESAGGGRQGAFARQGAFKGELSDKLEFEGIESKLKPEDIDELHNMITNNKVIGEFEKIPAAKGLEKLFKGQIPTQGELKLLNEVYGREFTDAAVSNLDKMKKISNVITDVLNVPRSVMSSMDLSAPLRQGAVMAPSHPKDFLRSFKNMFGYAFSQKKFDNFYDELTKRPTYQKMRESGLDITDLGGLSSREESFQSNLAEKIPLIGRLIKGSGRAYTGFLNNFRADLFDTLYKNGEKMGVGDDPTYIKSLADFINTATGRGKLSDIPGLGKQLESSAPLLNATFFSPRLIASRVSFFNPAMYAKMQPQVRKEAAKSIVSFVGTGLSILGLARLAGAEVETDPTSADFGKMKFGNTRYDIWGGFQPYATFIARMLLNRQKSTTTGGTFEYGEGYKPTTRYDVGLRFLQGKASPNASLVIDALKGEDFEGNKFDLTTTDPEANPIVKRLVPLMYNDIKDNINEYGPLGPILSIPGFFGVGQATYEMKPQKSSSVGRPSIGTSIR